MPILTHSAPDDLYRPSGDYAHAMEVHAAQRLLFVSGTMGLDLDGAAPPTVAEQLDLVWANLRAILAAAQMTVEHVVRVTSYLSDRAHAELNAAARVAALGGRPVATTAIVVQTLEPSWLVEVEIVAAA